MALLIVKLGDNVVQRFTIEKDVVSIGRARDNDIVVENLSVSRNHARIRHENGKFILTDLNSANGCFVNGVKLTKAELAHEDIISIGKHRLHFLMDEQDEEKIAPAQSNETAREEEREAVALPEGHVAALVVTRGRQANRTFRLAQAETTIGRSNENEIRLQDWHVSKRHAVVRQNGDRFVLKDLGSWGGTTVNGETVKERRLEEGDEIVFGSTMLQFRVGPEEQFAAETDEPIDEGMPEPQDDEDGSLDSLDAVRASAEVPATDADGEAAGTWDPDDEFAPMTDEELEALESEADLAHLEADPEAVRRAEMEQIEAEKMLEEGAGWSAREEELQAEEETALPEPKNEDLLEDARLGGSGDVEKEDAEEEKALFRGPVSDAEPQDEPVSLPESAQTTPAPAAGEEIPVPAGVDPKLVRVWTRALKNPSPVVRREAARKLKELTGTDYDWESEP